MLKIGLSSCGKPLTEELFKQYAAAGITYMEVSPSDEEADGLDWVSISKWAAQYKIKLWSFHLPFGPFYRNNISSPDEGVRTGTVAYQTAFIKKISQFGVENFIIHPSGEPIDPAERSVYMEQSKKSLKELAEVADECNVTLCVEDLPRTCLGNCSVEILELVGADDRLRICFDTNHLLGENIKDFIEAVGDKIVTTHVSDYDFENERHWLPQEGKIDWQELIATLKKVGYTGPWLYEIGFKAPKTIIRDRDLTCEDFAENAKCLFENKPYKTFCKHYEKLGLWEPIL